MNSNGFLAGKIFCLFFTLSGWCIQTYPQKIQYSRQNFRLPYSDGMQLVANIAGFHHLLFFAENQQPSIHIFDASLQLHSKKTLQLVSRKGNEIRIIPFTGFYYLYIHQPGSTKHELWRINPEGDGVSLSELFQRFIETAFKKNTSTLQLVNKNGQLFVIANTYYDALEKIKSTVVEADKDLNVVISRHVFYSFKLYEQQLKQVMLAGDDLLILKTFNDDSVGNVLQLIKANLNNGELLMNSFYSGSNIHSAPAFRYNAIDSSIIIYSLIQRTVFINKLDHLLNQKEPITFLKKQFSDNVSANFLLLKGASTQWVNMNFSITVFRRNARSVDITLPEYSHNQEASEGAGSYSIKMITQKVPSTFTNRESTTVGPAIRLTMLNEHFKLLKDSVVTNNKNSYTLHPGQFANVVLRKKSYLFLAQTFFNKKHGILMVTENDENYLTTTDIRVFEKYEYLLPQLKAVNNEYVIFPFTYKREIGLVKITINK